jgi:hypothetical protein
MDRNRVSARTLVPRLGLAVLLSWGSALIAPLWAQEAPPPESEIKKDPKKKLPPKGTGPGAPSGPAQAPPAFLLRADANCTVTIDGGNPVKVRSGEPRKVEVSNGQHLVNAVSDDGKLRWEGIVEAKSQQVVVQITLVGSTSPADFDRGAARVWLALSDLKVAGAYAGAILNKSWGFHDKNLSTAVYTAHVALKREMEDFKKIVPAPGDQLRRRIVDDMTAVGATADKYVDFLTKSISAAQQANSWLGEPLNLYSQAKALEPTLVLPANTMSELKSSRAFQDALPPDHRPQIGLPPDNRDFNMGADYYYSTPNLLAVVTKGGLADNWGFKAGDRILSVNGKPIASIWDFKMALRESPGGQMQVVYERGGKRETRDFKVPGQLQ